MLVMIDGNLAIDPETVCAIERKYGVITEITTTHGVYTTQVPVAMLVAVISSKQGESE